MHPDAIIHSDAIVHSDAILSIQIQPSIHLMHPDAIIQPDVTMHSDAIVHSDAVIHSDAIIHLDAIIHPNSIVHSDAAIHSDAIIHPDVTMHSDAIIHSDAVVHSDAAIHPNAIIIIHSDAAIHSDAIVHSDAAIHSDATIHPNAIIHSDAIVHSDAIIHPDATIHSDATHHHLTITVCCRCSACVGLDPENCTNTDMCGPHKVRQVTFKASNQRTDVPLTRSAPALLGATISCQVEVGDCIAIELDDVQVPWIVAQVLVKRHEHNSGEVDSWMGEAGCIFLYFCVCVTVHYLCELWAAVCTGTMRDHDQVLVVRRLEPTRVGSSMFYVTDQETYVFEEDVRRVVKLDLVETRSSSRTTGAPMTKRFTLPERERLCINEACAVIETKQSKRRKTN